MLIMCGGTDLSNLIQPTSLLFVRIFPFLYSLDYIGIPNRIGLKERKTLLDRIGSDENEAEDRGRM